MFQSTPSAREGDLREVIYSYGFGSFNPRLPRGKATGTVVYRSRRRTVSIHAFREGRRHVMRSGLDVFYVFQSTPSAREGDSSTNPDDSVGKCFNPRLPRGKATRFAREFWFTWRFQSTPSAREGDAYVLAQSSQRHGFNPRLPRGKATYNSSSSNVPKQFQSTPSAREGDCVR